MHTLLYCHTLITAIIIIIIVFVILIFILIFVILLILFQNHPWPPFSFPSPPFKKTGDLPPPLFAVDSLPSGSDPVITRYVSPYMSQPVISPLNTYAGAPLWFLTSLNPRIFLCSPPSAPSPQALRAIHNPFSFVFIDEKREPITAVIG